MGNDPATHESAACLVAAHSWMCVLQGYQADVLGCVMVKHASTHCLDAEARTNNNSNLQVFQLIDRCLLGKS